MNHYKHLYIVLLALLCGCSTWVRYNYEEACKHLPEHYIFVKATNDYVEYQLVENSTTNTYKAYYTADGTYIYKTDKH